MKTFIICLSKIESSFRSALEVQQKLKEFSVDAELFEGTYGPNAVKIFKKENRIVADIDSAPEEQTNLPGAKGCFYSHFRLWKKCIELNEPILILEDDVELVRGFIPVKWDEILIVATSWERKAKRYYHYLEDTDELPASVEYHPHCVPGTAGYGITPFAAKKLLSEYKNSYTLVDHAINKDVVNIKIHNKLMGKSTEHGNVSLINTNYWDN